MKTLVNFKGLNCFNNSILSIANENDIDYKQSFYNLWSEIEFDYNNELNIYSSKRLFENLAQSGLKITKIELNENFEALNLYKNELFVVGMDSFYISWSDYFKVRHDYHYFILQNITGKDFLCFDPTYNMSELRMSKSEILKNIFEIYKITISKPSNAIEINLKKELEDVAVHIEKLKKNIKHKIEIVDKKDVTLHRLTSKYIDTLINNRLMFKNYAQSVFSAYKLNNFMPENYFLTWLAVKNGLNKLSLTKNEKLSNEINQLLVNLLTKDITYIDMIKNYL